MGHRAAQAVGAMIVLVGALNLWFRIRDGAEWSMILGAAGLLLLFVIIFANTIQARRQNQPGPR
jgi:hypothetical protein